MHDVLGGCVDRVTGERDSFYSPLFGSSETKQRQYDEDGKYWKLVEHKGINLRGYTLEEKPFATSLKEQLDGLDPNFCIGMGYETIDGKEVLYADKKEKFYDASRISIYLNNVKQIKKYL